VHADPDWNPVNTTANPLGINPTPWRNTSETDATAAVIPDPATFLVASEMVMDARVIGACLELTYTGFMSESSGQIAYIHDLPINTLLTGGGGLTGCSVNELFQWCGGNSRRLGIDTFVSKYRPNEHSGIFREEKDSPITIGLGGVSATEAAIDANNVDPRLFGFAWRGIHAGQPFDFSVDAIKSLEWRSKPVSGLTHAPPVQINMRSMVKPALKALDTAAPHWNSTIKSSISSAAAAVSAAAFTGVATGAKTAAMSFGATILEDLGVASLALL
jgi:hypothetical protein